jgi:glutamyl-tRNA reductase
MEDLRLVSWDFISDQKALHGVLVKGMDYWEGVAKDSGLNNFIILSTCNRLEIYYIYGQLRIPAEFPAPNHVLNGRDAIMHLFRVASGLESISVGEGEILGQIKSAFDLYSKKGYVGKQLSVIFRKAISVGKLVREKTKISVGKVSIPSLVTDVINSKRKIVGSRICIVGSGKMATDIARYISKLSPSSAYMVSRSEPQIPVEGFEWHPMPSLRQIAQDCNIIITATSSRDPIIRVEDAARLAAGKILADVSFPANVEYGAENIPGVTVVRLESLGDILSENLKRKKGEIQKTEAILEQEIDALRFKLMDYTAEDAIRELYIISRMIEEKELSEYHKKVPQKNGESEAARLMLESAIGRILSLQTFALKNLVKTDRSGEAEKLIMALNEEIRRAQKHLSPSGDHQETRNRRVQTPP